MVRKVLPIENITQTGISNNNNYNNNIRPDRRSLAQAGRCTQPGCAYTQTASNRTNLLLGVCVCGRKGVSKRGGPKKGGIASPSQSFPPILMTRDWFRLEVERYASMCACVSVRGQCAKCSVEMNSNVFFFSSYTHTHTNTLIETIEVV